MAYYGSFSDYRNELLGNSGQQAPQGGVPSGNWQDFQNYYRQVAQANQQMQRAQADQGLYDSRVSKSREYQDNQGTYGMYNGRYRDANAFDTAAIKFGQWGEFWNNLPGQIAGVFGGDDAKRDWTFDASRFDLTDGLDTEDLNQAKNFVFSLPGMMVGGVFEGFNKGYEAFSGTPVQEYREKPNGGYEVADYTLDASQRAAAGIDAAINVAGTFTGGAGRVVGGVGKGIAKTTLKKTGREFGEALERGASETELSNLLGEGYTAAKSAYKKAAKTQDLLDGMSQGVVTRAFQAGRGGKPLGTGLGLLADAGDEAAEEFVQSYADDIRMKNVDEGSFGRALTGAAWGAAGGILMGAGGRALSHFSQIPGANKRDADSTPDQDVDEYTNRANNDSLDALRTFGTLSDRMYNQSAYEEMANYDREHRQAPGSSVFMQTGTDANLPWNQIDLGSENVEQIFYRDEASRKKLAIAFGADASDQGSIDAMVNTLHQIFNSRQNVAEKLNELMSQNGRGYIQVAVGRNPDTKNGGFLMNINKFYDGQKFTVHPAIMQLVGSDWDGDRASVYFDPNSIDAYDEINAGIRLDTNGYVLEQLIDPESGKSNIEWVWAGITKNSEIDVDALSKFLKGVFEGYDSKIGSEEHGSEYFKKAIIEAIATEDDDARDTAISAVLTELSSTINMLNAEYSGTIVRDGRTGGMLENGTNVISRLIHDVLANGNVIENAQLNYLADKASTKMLSFFGIDTSTDEGVAKVDSMRSEILDWQSRGTTGGSTLAFQLTKSIGLLTYLADPDSKYNPIYRQYGGVRYDKNSIPSINRVVEGLASIYGVESVTTNLLRSAFRLAHPGQDPTVAIETICDKLVMAETAAKALLGERKLRSPEDIKSFMRTFVEVQSKYSRMYNDAHSGVTNMGYQIDRESPYRNALDGVSEKPKGAESFFIPYEKEVGVGKMDDAFYRQFSRVYSGALMGDLFHDSVLKAIGASPDQTFEQFLEYYHRWSMKGDIKLKLQPIRESNPELASLIESCVNLYQSEQTAIAMGVEKALSDFDFRGFHERFNETGHIASEDAPMLLKFMDLVYEYIGADNALRMGFILSDEFIASDVGSLLFSGDPDSTMNVVLSASIYGQFIHLVEGVKSSDPIVAANAQEDLQDMRSISPIHEMIADSVLDGNEDVFEWFTSLGIEIKDKIKQYGFTAGMKFNKSNFVVAALQTDKSRFAISSISAKTKRANLAKNSVIKLNREKQLTEIEDFLEEIDSVSNGAQGSVSELEAWFNDRCKHTAMRYNDDMIAMKILASLTLDNAYVEKATIPEIISALFNAAELGENGGLLSHLNSVTSAWTGHMDKGDWLGNRVHLLACLSDPDYKCWVWDPDQGKNVLMTRDTLVRSANPQYQGGDLKDADIRALLRTYPQIAGYLCEPATNIVTLDGAMGVQLARGNSLIGDFAKWHEPRANMNLEELEKDTMRKAQMDNALADIRGLIFENPNAHKLITMMIDPEVLEGQVDPKKLTAEVKSALDHLSAYILWRAESDGIAAESPAKATNQAGFKLSVMRDLAHDLWESCAFANEMLMFDYDMNLSDALVRAILPKIATAAVAEEIAKTSGVNVDVGDYGVSSLAQTAVDNMLESSRRTLRVCKWLIQKQAEDTQEMFKELAPTLVNRDMLAKSLIRDYHISEADAIAQVDQAIENWSMFGDIDFSSKDLFSTSDFSDRSVAEQKIRDIFSWSLKYSGAGGNKVIPDTLDMIYDKQTGKLDDDLAAKLADDLNKEIIRHELVEISAMNGLPVNDNMVQLADEAQKSVEDFISSIVPIVHTNKAYANTLTNDQEAFIAEMKLRGLQYDTPPRFNYSSRTVQSSVTNQTASDPSARNPTDVGVNGSMQKLTFPFAHLPSHIDDLSYSMTRSMTKYAFTHMYDLEYNDFRALVVDENGDQKPVPVRSKAFHDYLDTLKDNDPVLFFHPDDNPHGLPTYNMLPAASNPKAEYHRLSGILNRIVQFSMEAMVLKTKKLMRTTDHLTVRRPINSAKRGESDSVVFDDLQKFFKDYRGAYTRALAHEFGEGGSMQSLQFGYDQARIVVQALTPGVVLQVKYSDGSFHPAFADAALFLGDGAQQRFEEFVNNVLSSKPTAPDAPYPVSIESAEIEPVTVSEAATRIMGYIANAAQGRKVKSSDAEAASIDALSDWSDYGEAYTGDVKSLMAYCPPVGHTTTSIIRATDNPVPPMMLANAMFGGSFGNAVKKDFDTPMHIADPKRDSQAFTNGQRIGWVSDDGSPLPIVRAWSVGRPSDSGYVSDREIKSLVYMFESENDRFKEIGGGTGICIDRTKIAEALKWANDTGGAILVPEDFVKNGRAYIPKSAVSRTGIKLAGTDKKFALLSGFKNARWFATRERNPRSFKLAARRSDITTTIVIDPEYSHPEAQPNLVGGDASIVAFKSMWNRMLRTPFDTVEYKLDSLLPEDSAFSKSFVNRAQATALLDKVSTLDAEGNRVALDDQVFADNGFLLSQPHVKDNDKIGKGTMQIKDMIVRYLADIAEGTGRAGSDPQPAVARRNDVAALVTDGKHISPVVYPNMPYDVQYSAVVLDGDAVVIHYSGMTPMFEDGVEGGQKWEIDGETFKGMVMKAMLDEGVNPCIEFCGTKTPASFAISSETEASRVGGMDEMMIANSLYYAMKMNDFSLFYRKSEADGKAVYSLNPVIEENWSDTDKADLLSGNPSPSLFRRIASGELKCASSPVQNNAIAQVFSSLLRSEISPMYFFSNYYLVKDEKTGTFTRRNFIEIDGTDDFYMDIDHKLVLQDIIPNTDKLFALYSAIDERLCPTGLNDPRIGDDTQRGKYIVGVDGTSLVSWKDGGQLVPMTVRYGRNKILGETTLENTPSGSASVSGQHTGSRAADKGYAPDLVDLGARANFLATGHYDEALDSYLAKRNLAAGRKRDDIKYIAPRDMSIAAMYPGASRSELIRNKSVSEVLPKTFAERRAIIGPDGKYIDSDEKFQTSKCYAARSRLNNLCDTGTSWSWGMVDQICKLMTASSWTDNMGRDENGKWTVTDAQLAEAIDRIVSGIEGPKHLPVTVQFSDSANSNNRFCMPLLPKEIAEWCWNTFSQIREFHGTFENFVEAMKAEQVIAENAVNHLAMNKGHNHSRYIALSDMARALCLQYDITSSLLPVDGQWAFPELDMDVDSLAAKLSSANGWNKDQMQLFKSLVSASQTKYEYLRKRLEELGYKADKQYQVNGDSRIVAYTRVDEAKDLTNLLNNAAELSKVMAVINPLITVGNLTDRVFHQGTMRATLFLGNKLRIGPYKSQKSHIVPTNIRKMSVEDEAAVELYQSYRDMEFTSEEMLLIQEIIDRGNIQEAIAFVNERKKEMEKTVFGKVHDWAYKSAGGFNFGLKSEMQNVVDRFVMFAEANGETFWFEPAGEEFKRLDGTPMTRLDAILAQPGGFANLMIFCLGKNSPSYSTFCQAMNSAKQGDLAQKNAIGLVLNDICRKMPFGNFLMTTAVSRFPMYGLNITGRLLNYILPISSMNRAFNEFLSKTEYGKKLGVEEVNVHTSMREAVLVDVIKLGVGGCAIALFGISGAVQPPDDERKWGNIDEWIVFGTRAGESWWIEDLLGMALPLACFWKACEQGKPRFDILLNGIGSVCYSNPILRCGDVASFLMNPAESLVSDYNEDIVQFENAKGGAPSFGQYLQTNAFSLGMNWASQFVTPSIVREWWRASQPLEKSYKRYWDRSDSGAITEEGRSGKTEYVTYDEAMKRKLAIRNPLLAYLFTISSGMSYMPGDMPDTVYYDDEQLDSTLVTSVSGLEGEERLVKVIQLIGVLQSYDNMDELVADGFHLDYETLQAVASQVWDNYHAADDWYNTMQANGQLNYYVLGNGDYDEGMRIAAELKKERDQTKQYWYDFYYNKLKDSPISLTMQTYNRYNTTYAQDVNGEVYATGIQRSPLNILPFTNAPGSVENPEGTAGYNEDWMSLSAVTGRPLDQRALIPADSGKFSLPDFKELSADGNGNSYSKQYESVYGPGMTTTPSTSTYPSGSGGGYSYGGGGGGGGRSYTPNTYAPSTNLSKSNPSRIMNTSRVVKPDYDYLRPDFETKGSREAYKRSDI